MGSTGRRSGADVRDRPVEPAPILSLPLLVAAPALDGLDTEALGRAGVHVSWCRDAGEALVLYGRTNPSVVILVPSVPGVACAEAVAVMRRLGSPLILLGVGEGEAELAGPPLMAGATAMVRRPFSTAEILQRVRSAPAEHSRARIDLGPLSVDLLAHAVWVGGDELPPMPPKEFGLLVLLTRYADRVVTVEQIKTYLWPGARPSDKSVAVHVRRLRTRLPAPLTVRTIRGLGYRLTLY